MVGAPLALLVLAGAVLSACSSSPSGSPSSSASTSTTAHGSSNGSGTAASLGTFTARLQSAETKTYKLVYEVQQGSGSTQTITFEQSPPRSAVLTANGSVINTGSETLYCSNASGTVTCIKVAGPSPFAALTALFDPQQVAGYIHTFDGMVADHLAGVSVQNSSRTIAGQPSSCVTVSASGGRGGTWCVTTQGLLAYSSTTPGTSSVTLTSFSPSVNSSDFAPPPGATINTLPGGVPLPN